MGYVAKLNNNWITIYDAQSGAIVRRFSADGVATSVSIQGNIVTVNKTNGWTDVYNADTGERINSFV
jgi:hypothetical protein